MRRRSQEATRHHRSPHGERHSEKPIPQSIDILRFPTYRNYCLTIGKQQAFPRKFGTFFWQKAIFFISFVDGSVSVWDGMTESQIPFVLCQGEFSLPLASAAFFPTFIFKRPPPPLKIQANQTTAEKGEKSRKDSYLRIRTFPRSFCKNSPSASIGQVKNSWPCVPLSTAPSFPLLFWAFF